MHSRAIADFAFDVVGWSGRLSTFFDANGTYPTDEAFGLDNLPRDFEAQLWALRYLRPQLCDVVLREWRTIMVDTTDEQYAQLLAGLPTPDDAQTTSENHPLTYRDKQLSALVHHVVAEVAAVKQSNEYHVLLEALGMA